MKVVLTQNIKDFGQKGEVKEVSNGYFRNFLAPKGMAIIATGKQVAHVQVQKAKATEKLENMKESAESIKKKIDGKVINLEEKASDKGKLFAAVSNKEVAEHLKTELKVDVPAKQVKMKTIKEAGEFKATVELYKGVTAEITLNVTATE
jgi:large subunit ribosomal protein L9